MDVRSNHLLPLLLLSVILLSIVPPHVKAIPTWCKPSQDTYSYGQNVVIQFNATPDPGLSYYFMIYKPDGSEGQLQIGIITNSYNSEDIGEAGPPPGQRQVELWYHLLIGSGGNVKVATCSYNVQGPTYQPPPPQTSTVYLYSLPDSFRGQDPSTLTGSDLGASISVSYVSNGQPQSTIEPTRFTVQADVGSQITFSVASSPSGWQSNCMWDHYGYGQSSSCTLSIQVQGNDEIVAFFTPSFTCPAYHPQIANVVSGNTFDEIFSNLLKEISPVPMPLADDWVRLVPQPSSIPISHVQLTVSETDGKNLADLSSNPYPVPLQSDGTYYAAFGVQSSEDRDPEVIAWSLANLAATVAEAAGYEPAQILEKLLEALGVALEPPPDVTLTYTMTVVYSNGTPCSYGPYTLPTYNTGVKDNAYAIVDYVLSFGWLFVLHSNADLFATDSSGRREGAVYVNDVYSHDVNEIPNAIYSGHGTTPQTLLLPNGEYTLQVFGTGDGSYVLKAGVSADGIVQSYSGTTSVGSTDTYSLSGTSISHVAPTMYYWYGLAATAVVAVGSIAAAWKSRSRRGRRSSTVSRFCLECGRPLRPGAKYCLHDGTPVRKRVS
jgi:hypothetical protein